MFCSLQINNAKFRKLIGTDARAETMEKELDRVIMFVSLSLSICCGLDEFGEVKKIASMALLRASQQAQIGPSTKQRPPCRLPKPC